MENPLEISVSFFPATYLGVFLMLYGILQNNAEWNPQILPNKENANM